MKLFSIGIALMSIAGVCMAAGVPNLIGQTDRPLRYRPEGTDFIIENGAESYNRPLYGDNTPFRVDGGDKPEFSFYLPGRGGNVRFGIVSGDTTKWLVDAKNIIARYRAGSMIYDITDPALGSATLRLTAMALFDGDGFIAKAEIVNGEADVDLIVAFGGVHGSKGARNGDIGTEKISMREFFKYKPEYSADNKIELTPTGFKLTAKAANFAGGVSPSAKWNLGDPAKWDDLGSLLKSQQASDAPSVAFAKQNLKSAAPVYTLIQPGDSAKTDDLAKLFSDSENARAKVATRLVVQTPDPYINAAVAALNAASEGTWDGKENAIMHGAVAWRNKLLGWRGIYWPDVMGEHDRTRLHLANWFKNQNSDPIPAKIPAPEAEGNLARNEDALHSNGNLTSNHYDMNLVAIDALFRHLLWTGDKQYAEQVWPVIEKHLAWERRLFRREFGPEKLPLYESYACIWASDDLSYNGGGATHATAYNLYHNRMAARIATWIGKDPAPYKTEADLIARAMKEHLWVKDGWYAEWKDIIGLGLVHPNAGLYTFYHTVDSEAVSQVEAWQMSRFVDTQIPRIPIKGKDVPAGDFYTLPTTNWMPEAWSTNVVVMAEVAHTALALWQSNRGDDAMNLFKGAILDSMYLGQCPGNVGMCTPSDMLRGEAQRDFADGCGALSRSVIEGLFGIKPDLIDKKITFAPCFPVDWATASITHADLDFGYRRDGDKEIYAVRTRFNSPVEMVLQVPARKNTVKNVLIDGAAAKWKSMPDVVGFPRIEVVSPAGTNHEISIEWTGAAIQSDIDLGVVAAGEKISVPLNGAKIEAIEDPQGALLQRSFADGKIAGIATDRIGHRTIFAWVSEGQVVRWLPIALEIREPVEIVAEPTSAVGSIAFRVRNNSNTPIDANATIRWNGNEHSRPIKAGAREDSQIVKIDKGLSAGTTRVAVDLGANQTLTADLTNWSTPIAGGKLESVDLSKLFNDSVSKIFQNEYLSPRSPFTSLAVPKQGFGTWCKPAAKFDVNDAGLRALGGTLKLPNGVTFSTPSAAEAKNIAFTSRWDNYPAEITIPLAGRASHAYLLMAGSTSSMQSRFNNGEVIVTYDDNTTERLKLINPMTWWPIDRDYKIDDFAFAINAPLPPRVNLKTGEARILDPKAFKGKGGVIAGGAATVLDMPLSSQKQLKSLTVRTIANEIVIGLMGITLERPATP